MSEYKPVVEWPTLALLVATYAIWAAAVFWLSTWSVLLAVVVATLAVVQQSSLQHEVLHGHPLRWQWLNELMVRPSLNLAIPYGRFRDTHLAHHHDANLTDPYDDPETNFLAEGDWQAHPMWMKLVYRINNTLAGRMLIGPALGQWAFMRADVVARDLKITLSWGVHLVFLIGLVWLVMLSPMPRKLVIFCLRVLVPTAIINTTAAVPQMIPKIVIAVRFFCAFMSRTNSPKREKTYMAFTMSALRLFIRSSSALSRGFPVPPRHPI